MFKNALAKYYQKNKDRLQKKYKDLSEEEKIKKRQYGCKQYKSLSEDEKERLQS